MTANVVTIPFAQTSEKPAPLLQTQTVRPLARGVLWFWAVVITLAYALLWSPNWYPLSDSSLYLSLGRSFAAGRGLTMMGDVVKLTPPLAPLLIALIIKLGGGIGTIQAVMIALMLLAHLFCFLTLRRIVGERLALAATVAAAMSYWVYANAFTIMSEPPAMALMWAGAWLLTCARDDEVERTRLWKVVGACFLMLGAVAARDAVFLIAPGFLLLLPGATRPGLKVGAILFALAISLVGVFVMIQAKRGRLPPWTWSAAVLAPVGLLLIYWGWRRRQTLERLMDHLRVPLARKQAWTYLAIFAGVMGGWMLVYRYPPKVLTGIQLVRSTQPTTGPTAEGALPPTPVSGAEGDEDVSREGRYKAQWLYGVKRDWHLITDPPQLGGRWVAEGLVGATNFVFESKVHWVAGIGYIVSLAALILCTIGLVVMLRAGHWWLLGAAVYFLAIWLQWGIRLKARYMIPIAPLLFLGVWTGVWTVWSLGRVWRERRAPAADDKLGRRLAIGLAALVILGNLFPWCVEFRVRHLSGDRDFYDVARRGAFSELVDIGAWAQKNIGPQETIWMNAGAQRRIAYFLTGRRIETQEHPARNWSDWDSSGGEIEKYAKPLRFFRRQVPDRFIIVYVDHPQRGASWPGWHWPLTPWPSKPNFWRLYEKRSDGTMIRIAIPRADRSYLRAIPKAGM